MNDNRKLKLVGLLLSLNTFLFVFCIIAVFTRFSRSDFNRVFKDYNSQVNSNLYYQASYISNLTERACGLLHIFSRQGTNYSSEVVHETSSDDFRYGRNLISTNSPGIITSLNPRFYKFYSCGSLRFFDYKGCSFTFGDCFIDGGIVRHFDEFALQTTVGFYNVLDLSDDKLESKQSSTNRVSLLNIGS